MAGKTTKKAAAKKKTAKKSAKVAKKAGAKRVAAKPTLLSGGNPQIAKADGDAPVQAYIAAAQPLAATPERLFQGAIADALTHVGQIAMLRRLAGATCAGRTIPSRRSLRAGRVHCRIRRPGSSIELWRSI